MSIRVVLDPTRGLIQTRGPASFIIVSGSTVDLGSSAVYSPQNPSDWSAVPADVIQAIDYLAAGSGSGGGGASPGGLNGQLQYRVDASTFGGVDKLTFVGGNLVGTGSFNGAFSGSLAGGVTGDLYGTASYALDSELFDGRDSTTFAGLTANTFSGVQIFNNVITGTSGFFSGDLIIAGTASVGLLETRGQQSLQIGDKYIVILSGAVDHTTLDGSGILYGSGGLGPTVDEFGANASVRYRNAHDKLEIFPGLRVTGSLIVTGDAEITGTLTVGTLNSSGGVSARYQTFSSNFTVTSTQYFCAINSSAGAVTASLSRANVFTTGQSLIFKDVGGFAGTSSKSILINASGSDKIDGLSSAVISVNSGSISLITDGISNWFITSIF